MKFTVQYVFCYIGRILRWFCATIITVFYYGTDLLFPAYTKNSLIVDFDIVVMFQTITDTSVPHVRMFIMDLLHLF